MEAEELAAPSAQVIWFPTSRGSTYTPVRRHLGDRYAAYHCYFDLNVILNTVQVREAFFATHSYRHPQRHDSQRMAA